MRPVFASWREVAITRIDPIQPILKEVIAFHEKTGRSASQFLLALLDILFFPQSISKQNTGIGDLNHKFCHCEPVS